MSIERKTMTTDAERPASAGSAAPEDSLLNEHRQAWEAFAVCVVRLIPVLKAQMTSVTQETERATIDLLAHLRVLAAENGAVTTEDKLGSLSKVVMAMQFQDITRQKLEHVGQALDQWRLHLQALMRGPEDEDATREIAALQQIEQSYTMEEERRLHASAVTFEYQDSVPSDMTEDEVESDSITLF